MKQDSQEQFNADLRDGQKIEQIVLKRIQNKYPLAFLAKDKCVEYDIFIPEKEIMVEVKYDRLALKTGNVAVEFEYKGKPSGIFATKSQYWAYVIDGVFSDVANFSPDDPQRYKIKWIRTMNLYDYVFKNKGKVVETFGKSKCVLIPLKDFYSLGTDIEV